jgi:hypothetical protein
VRPPRFVLLAVAALGVACGGGGSPTTPSEVASGLTGTWRVTRAEYINATNSAQSVDVIAQGTTMTLVLQAGGTFTLTIVDPGQAANVVTGTWTSSRDVLTIVRTAATWSTTSATTGSPRKPSSTWTSPTVEGPRPRAPVTAPVTTSRWATLASTSSHSHSARRIS